MSKPLGKPDRIVVALGGNAHATTADTQIECDPDDPAFANPTKPIGPFYTEEQAREIMAENPEADVLFLLTAVEHVAINFGKPDQQELEELTADEAERLADEGQFGKGSMEPMVRASVTRICG